MDGIKRVSNGKTKHHHSSAAHKTLQKSTTLNRKFVKKPAVAQKVVTRSQTATASGARRQGFAAQSGARGRIIPRQNIATIAPKKSPSVTQKADGKIAPAATHPTVSTVNARITARKAESPKQLTAQELKDRAIKQALQRVATMGDNPTEEEVTEAMTKKRHVWKKRKMFVAFSMAAASIALLGYLVHLNLPDLSVKVAAMQSGIESAYPAYIPKDYRMDGLVAEKDGKITINFTNKNGSQFVLVEEKSSWDSSALLSQFVAPNWGDDYTVVKEQGLTIYISGSDAAWVNGGIFYHIDDTENNLTSQQLHDIALSL